MINLKNFKPKSFWKSLYFKITAEINTNPIYNVVPELFHLTTHTKKYMQKHFRRRITKVV